jgi:single-stranded-DNA-specific exonuclease
VPEIKNLEKSAERIKKAIRDKEKILLFADADLDGTASSILLEEAIKSLGGKVFLIYFPDREVEGYGLNKEALEEIKKYAPGLLITLDCGIGNFDELKTAKDIGFETIVVDHHEILGKVPEHGLVVDPKQEGDEFPFKKMATAGIVFYLAKKMLASDFSPSLENSFLELVALATLADLMPEQEDNKVFLEKGVNALFATFRPGLRAVLGVLPYQVGLPRQITQKIIPILNITDIKNHLTECYILLTAVEMESARALAQTLLEKSRERYSLIVQTTEEAEERISGNDDKPFIFEGDKQWLQILTGAVASRLCNRYKKPVFIFKISPKVSRGSVRTTKMFDSVEALRTCSNFLETYGGHPQASGFTVKNENLESLKKCLEDYFSKPAVKAVGSQGSDLLTYYDSQ